MLEVLLASKKKSAAIGPSYALMGGGNQPQGQFPTAITDKYDFSSKAVAAGTAFLLPQIYLPGAGNASLGVWSGGNNGGAGGSTITSRTTRYTWSGDTVAAGTNLPGTDTEQGATSTANTAYFGGGAQSATIVRKYTFTSDAWAGGTALNAGGKGYPSSTGNGTVGLFTGVGGNIRYTYSGDTVAAGAGLTQFRSRSGGMSISTAAVFACGWGDGGAGLLATSDRYTYASNTNVASTSFQVARQRLSACTDGVIGLAAGGVNAGAIGLTVVEEYVWANSTVAVGSSMIVSHNNFGAVASVPAHLS